MFYSWKVKALIISHFNEEKPVDINIKLRHVSTYLSSAWVFLLRNIFWVCVPYLQLEQGCEFSRVVI